ncbi:class I SAM-dependent methyltransferase [Microbacterium yannicii]|uniref:Class I SAM-dependent methyltransferase n=1 Tax=Microbacterium yannicii TaxID=671622 RepID=A0ABP9LVY8_9MICO|nr:methyltransferase domain-containing protein [Microbacterium yannicii]MCO5953570.1 methyltransferase domain-containing protein [Microbacterium yannicii]
MSLAVRDEGLAELMDDPSCDPDRLRATLRRFGTVNRLVSGWGAVYRHTLAPHLRALGRPARVLDVGCGGGDVVLRLAAEARRDGLEVEWTGIDPDPRSYEVAVERGPVDGVTFRRADAATLVGEGLTFDAVLSNHVLHHLGADLPEFAAESLALSHGLVLHSDIARSRLAYALYAIGITPLAPGTFLRTDGLRSIRRSYTATELAAKLDDAMPGTWTVQIPVPFRVLAVGRGRG